MNDRPLALATNPDGNGLHQAAAVGLTVTGLDVHVQGMQAVGTMVAVIRTGTGRNHQSAAVLTGKTFLAGMVLVITLLKLLTLVFSIHGIYSVS